MGKCQIKRDKRKKNIGFLEYDYESAYKKSLEDIQTHKDELCSKDY